MVDFVGSITGRDGKRYPASVSVKADRAPLGFANITTLTSATNLTVPAGASLAVLQAESQDVRWRDDGVAPTGTVGMLLKPGETYEYVGDLDAIQFIQTAASASLNVTFY